MRSLLLLALLAAPAGASKVWVVDAALGAGADFADIQSAIFAAADGDTLLVRPGSYPAFVLQAKGLEVTAEYGFDFDVPSASVRGLLPGQHAVIRRMSTASVTEEGLQVKNCAGPVWIEECVLRGAQGDGLWSSPAQHDAGYAGAVVQASVDVVFQSCVFRGGVGDTYVPLTVSPGQGGPGLHVKDDARVAVFAGSVTGGDAGHVADDDAAWTGPTGGPGVLFDDGQLLVLGAVVTGGAGGTGGEDYDLWTGYSCANGGEGGDAIGQAAWGQTVFADLVLVDTLLQPGPGGPPYPGAPCNVGVPGVPLALWSGTVDQQPGAAFRARFRSPIRDGTPVGIMLHGPPGGLVLLAVGTGQALLPLAGMSGALALSPAGAVVQPLGVVPASGDLLVTAPLVFGVPAGASLAVWCQAVGIDPTTAGGPTVVLGGGSHLLVLDPAL